VSRGKIVFESLYEHNSRSVGVLQIRLLELGYVAAGSDNRGYLSDGTLAAIKEFAGDHGLEANKIDNEQLMKSIFAGTPVTVGT
jgi:peptidoglycan hydrolase-like protein with peptidoglycan-binding domain